MTKKQLNAIRTMESEAFANGLERSEVATFVDAAIQDLAYRLFGGVCVRSRAEIDSRYTIFIGYDMSRTEYIEATAAQDAIDHAETIWLALNTTDNACTPTAVGLHDASGACVKRWDAIAPDRTKTPGPGRKRRALAEKSVAALRKEQWFVTSDGYKLHFEHNHWTDGDLRFECNADGFPIGDTGEPLEGDFA